MKKTKSKKSTDIVETKHMVDTDTGEIELFGYIPKGEGKPYPFQTPYRRHKTIEEVNNLPSETVPDQSMGVKEIMDRYAKGLPISGQRVPIYEGDTEFPDVKHMDLAEIQELQERTAEELEQIKEKQLRWKERQAVINQEKADRRLKELTEERRQYRRQNPDQKEDNFGQEDEKKH